MEINTTHVLIFAIIVTAIFLIMLCTNCKSTFGAGSSKESTSIKPTINKDSTLIFYAPWCGHCKNAMPEFEKAVEGGNGNIFLIDATDSKNEELAKGIKGFPTITKNGNTKTFNGARTAEDIVKFSENE